MKNAVGFRRVVNKIIPVFSSSGQLILPGEVHYVQCTQVKLMTRKMVLTEDEKKLLEKELGSVDIIENN